MLYLPYSFMVVWEESLDANAKTFSVSRAVFFHLIPCLIYLIVNCLPVRLLKHCLRVRVFLLLALRGERRGGAVGQHLGEPAGGRHAVPGGVHARHAARLPALRAAGLVDRGRLPGPLRRAQAASLLPAALILDGMLTRKINIVCKNIFTKYCPGPAQLRQQERPGRGVPARDGRGDRGHGAGAGAPPAR